ncbi:MAG: hypothetical protein LBS33_06410 [Streptococcaceae bacterium]|jgi:outer membrane murein-binding lipoprotein Lpp|nr:hypothetical protein [Streptococcaceae bacterium]
MKKKNLVVLAAALLISGTVLTGCSSDKSDNKDAKTEKSSTKKSDTTTGASITNDATKLAGGLGEHGFWLVAITEDVTSDKDITVKGSFKDEEGTVARELALYKSNPDTHKPDALYTLTVPKLTIESENFGIAQGTVKGDVYANAKGFHFESDADKGTKGTVDGNLIFKTQALKDAYDGLADDQKGTVTGEIKVAE